MTHDIGLQVLLTGSADEAPLLDELQRLAGLQLPALVGPPSLGALAGVLEMAPLLLSNTGPVHIAAAVGTPVIDLYAMTNPQHTPWRVPTACCTTTVSCRSCYSSTCKEGHHACLGLVEPGEVVAAAELLLEAKDQAGQ